AAALPLLALPEVDERLVDGPEPPPAPVPPLFDVPVPVDCPLPPVGPVTAGATVVAVGAGSRLSVAASARTPSSPDMRRTVLDHHPFRNHSAPKHPTWHQTYKTLPDLHLDSFGT